VELARLDAQWLGLRRVDLPTHIDGSEAERDPVPRVAAADRTKTHDQGPQAHARAVR
jgi:hypothetical protein